MNDNNNEEQVGGGSSPQPAKALTSVKDIITALQYPWKKYVNPVAIQEHLKTMSDNGAHWRPMYAYVHEELGKYFYWHTTKNVMIYKDNKGNVKTATLQQFHTQLLDHDHYKVLLGKKNIRPLARIFKDLPKVVPASSTPVVGTITTEGTVKDTSSQRDPMDVTTSAESGSEYSSQDDSSSSSEYDSDSYDSDSSSDYSSSDSEDHDHDVGMMDVTKQDKLPVVPGTPMPVPKKVETENIQEGANMESQQQQVNQMPASPISSPPGKSKRKVTIDNKSVGGKRLKMGTTTTKPHVSMKKKSIKNKPPSGLIPKEKSKHRHHHRKHEVVIESPSKTSTPLKSILARGGVGGKSPRITPVAAAAAVIKPPSKRKVKESPIVVKKPRRQRAPLDSFLLFDKFVTEFKRQHKDVQSIQLLFTLNTSTSTPVITNGQ